MTGFNTDDYIDVAERVRLFATKFPEGSLQSEVELYSNGEGSPVGVLCKAYAYRSAADERPGIGHAYEPIPGKTPFTRDSEVMNAETSAWGRAIVALGFETKKIASADEVRARSAGGPRVGHDAQPTTGADAGSGEVSASSPPAEDPVERARRAQEEAKARRAPHDGGIPSRVRIHFGKNGPGPEHPLGLALGELTKKQLGWYAEIWEPQDRPEDRRLKLAAKALHAGEDTPDFDIPF